MWRWVHQSYCVISSFQLGKAMGGCLSLYSHRRPVCLQDDVHMPGSKAYDALINMHKAYGWAVNSKVRHP